MKKITLIFIAFTFIAQQTKAQTTAAPDTLWRKGGLLSLNFNQASFSNWAAGGQNSIAGNFIGAVFANYKHDKWAWDNNFDVSYGTSKTGVQGYRKTDDRVLINSKVGYEFKKNLYFTYLFNFRTQMAPGYSYTDTTEVLISDLLTPGTVINSLGIDWKPATGLALFLSPLTLRTTLVQNSKLIDQAELANQTLFGVDPGKNVRQEFGAYFVGTYNKEIMKNVVFNTKLELFSNYAEDPQNIDVNWEVGLLLKVNNYINILINTQLIYDNDVFVPKEDTNAPAGPGTQFRETLGVGFSYKFAGYGVK